MHIRSISAMLLGLVLVGCAPARLLDTVTPEGIFIREANIAYGALPRQKLDVYRPPQPDLGRTAVIFFYGGGWRSGARADYRFVAELLTRRGITVIVPDYRIYPDAVFPAFAEDAALAMAWVQDNAVKLSVDPQRIFLIGHSAGAHIATLLALDRRHLAAVGKRPDDIAGVVGISGPYDFLPITSPRVREIFAEADDLADTQPITFARPGAPPMLLVHGTSDRTVYPRNAERLAEKLRAAGSPVRLVLYPGLGHVDIMLGLSSVLMGQGELLRDIAEFFAAPRVVTERGLDLSSPAP